MDCVPAWKTARKEGLIDETAERETVHRAERTRCPSKGGAEGYRA
jgi:hypothetical protein